MSEYTVDLFLIRLLRLLTVSCFCAEHKIVFYNLFYLVSTVTNTHFMPVTKWFKIMYMLP